MFAHGARGSTLTSRIQRPTTSAIADAAARLRRGELVAFPTETVYGLGAHALDPEAVARIYAAKGRPAWNPVIVHVADAATARTLVAEWPAHADTLAEACWPGPLTLVLRRHDRVPSIVSAGTNTVALRVPAHPVALALLREARLPIAAPSANRFTKISPTTAQHVADGLGEEVGLILDGGACAVGIESTVLDLTSPQPTILRPGGIDAGTLSELLRTDVVSPSVAPTAADGDARLSPGQSSRHYAPRAEVWLVDAQDATARTAAQRAIDALPRATLARVGLLGRSGGLALANVSETITVANDPAQFARALYAALHAFDATGCTHIVIEAPPVDAAWDAVRDRLRRATHRGDRHREP